MDLCCCFGKASLGILQLHRPDSPFTCKTLAWAYLAWPEPFHSITYALLSLHMMLIKYAFCGMQEEVALLPATDVLL